VAQKANTALLLAVLGILTCGILEFWAYAQARDVLRALEGTQSLPGARAKATAAIWIARIFLILVFVSSALTVLVNTIIDPK